MNETQKVLDQVSDQIILIKEEANKKQPKNINKLLKILSKQEWILDMGIYGSLNMTDVIPKIQEAKVKKLWLGYNTHSQILTQILPINFPCVKELYLAHNQLSSLQPLVYLNCPQLQQIQLRENVFHSLKPLKKLKLHQLRVLSIYNNSVLDPRPCVHMISSSIKNLWLQYEDKQPVQGQSIAWIAKLQSSQLKSIAAGSSFRMKETHIQKSLKQKYENFKVYRSLKNSQF